MSEVIKKFEDFLFNKKDIDLMDFIVEGAIGYYSMVRHIGNDYVTKDYISKNLENDFSEFYAQANVTPIIDEFIEESGSSESELYDELDKNKSDYVMLLGIRIGTIASQANKDED